MGLSLQCGTGTPGAPIGLGGRLHPSYSSVYEIKFMYMSGRNRRQPLDGAHTLNNTTYKLKSVNDTRQSLGSSCSGVVLS